VSISGDLATGTIDFSDTMVFGPQVGINPTSVACRLSGSQPRQISTTVHGNTVKIALGSVDLNATTTGSIVTCDVDQSVRSSPGH